MTASLQPYRDRARAHQADIELASKPKLKRAKEFLVAADAAEVVGVSCEMLLRLAPPSMRVGPNTPRWSIEDLWSLHTAYGESQVYAIRRADTREVKIGISTNPIRRLRDLQSAHGERLELLLTFPGGVHTEYELHERFSAHRKRGEWFHESPEITAWIAEVS